MATVAQPSASSSPSSSSTSMEFNINQSDALESSRFSSINMLDWSGLWEGNSTSESRDSTVWKNTALVFCLYDEGNSTMGSIRGSGISIWRNMDIEFVVHGSFDLTTGLVRLTKEHIGRYTNSIEYICVISNFTLIGKYPDGTIYIQKVEDFPENPPIVAIFDGPWSGASRSHSGETTEWVDLMLRFNQIRNSKDIAVSGHGISIWRNQEIRFDLKGTLHWNTMQISLSKKHKGRYTNGVTYTAIFNAENQSIYGDYIGGRIALKRSYEPISRNLYPKAEYLKGLPLVDLVNQLSRELSGAWYGQSVDVDENPTSWTDTKLQFVINPINAKAIIQGTGVSLWRGKKIKFVLTGCLMWETGEILLKKRHQGCFNNLIQYEGQINFIDHSGTVRPLSFKEFCSRQNLIQSNSNSFSDSIVSIEGEYQKGHINLTKRTEDKNGLNSSHDTVDRFTKYRIFLSGVLSGGRITVKDIESLTKFRSHHGVTDNEHKEALTSLGYDETKLNRVIKDMESLESEDKCKICFSNSINSVLLPCGHFSVCLDCGRCLENCPFCRKRINKVQQVYRS